MKLRWTIAALGLLSCERPGALKSEADQALYTVGYQYGEKISHLQFTAAEMELIFRGIRDGAAKKTNASAAGPNMVQDFLRQRLGLIADGQKKKGDDFLAEFIRSGGQKSPSGMGYKIIKAGSDARATEGDSVVVHYHGSLTDGSVFESSMDKQEKATFPFAGVLPGWQEALGLIGEGGKIELVVPAELGYGDYGAPPRIPGGATLLFTLELYEIKRGG